MSVRFIKTSSLGESNGSAPGALGLLLGILLFETMS
jgi:hypothetical protein